MTCDYDPPAFFAHSEPVARKQHACMECNAPILPGEKHFSFRGKWKGHIDTGRQHLLCMEACMYIRDNIQDGECIPFGGMGEFLCEYQYDIADDAKLQEMVTAIRKRESRKDGGQ